MLFIVPEPETIASSRVDLTFGLRSAIQFHREQTIPGIGGVWFGRQLSWAISGIKIYSQPGTGGLNASPILIANAVEALSCKTMFHCIEPYPYRGSRAFSRDQGNDVWGFKSLTRARHYVQITYRQGTVRALPEGTGLGFVSGSAARFNSMALTPVGNNLADAFLNRTGIGRGSGSVLKFIQEWLENKVSPKNGTTPRTVYELMGPDKLSQPEKAIISGRLGSLIHGGAAKSDPRRRERLSKIFLKLYSADPEKISFKNLVEQLKSNGGSSHAAHIFNAIVFEQMLENAVSLLSACADEIDNSATVTVSQMAAVEKVKKAYAELKKSADTYLSRMKQEDHGPFPQDAKQFAMDVIKSCRSAIVTLVQRDGRILRCLDEKIMQGSLFRTGFSSISLDDDPEGSQQQPDDQQAQWPLQRLQQWDNLWRECNNFNG